MHPLNHGLGWMSLATMSHRSKCSNYTQSMVVHSELLLVGDRKFSKALRAHTYFQKPHLKHRTDSYIPEQATSK